MFFLERHKSRGFVMIHNNKGIFWPFWKGKKYAFPERHSASLSRKAISKPFQKATWAPFPKMLAEHLSRTLWLSEKSFLGVLCYEFIKKAFQKAFRKPTKFHHRICPYKLNVVFMRWYKTFRSRLFCPVLQLIHNTRVSCVDEIEIKLQCSTFIRYILRTGITF